DNLDHFIVDVAQNVTNRHPGLLSKFPLFSRLKINLWGTMPGMEEACSKLQSTPLNSLMIMPNYSYAERDAIAYLCTLATAVQKLPREQKRFLTYHRLAWNILSQSEQVKKSPGWQVQLLVWIFCCWQWKDQINVIIK
ncbi:hypothetical protein KI387_021431, partial [Taxus chinensis]